MSAATGTGPATLQVLHPPIRFGIVEPGVYRTDVPKLHNFPFLRQLGLQTCLLLTPEKPLRELVEFFREADIKLIHLGTMRSNDWKPVSEDLVKDAIELLVNPETRPVIIMCSSGVHQTGVVVGCLRRLQNWSISACLHEYRMYADTKAREMTELFIELFDPDLVSVSAEQLVLLKKPPDPGLRDRAGSQVLRASSLTQ